jgi:hypothetical protein
MKTYLSTRLKAKGADPATVINRAIELAKEKTTLVFPDGIFYLYSQINIFNKGIRLEGAEDTQIRVHHNDSGIIASRNTGTSRLFIERLNFLNTKSDANNPNQHCLEISAPVTIEDVTIEGFFGNGLHLTGDTYTRVNTDVSFSKVQSIVVQNCKGHGIYLAGGDANAGLFIHVDVRDNGGYGIWDNSFLGNTWINVMAHLNKLGNYRAGDTNNRATFVGCYSEEGSPLTEIGGSAMVFGGLWGGGVIVKDNAAVDWNGKVGNYTNQ